LAAVRSSKATRSPSRPWALAGSSSRRRPATPPSGGAAAISNLLDIGNNDGPAESARVRISRNDNLADTADVIV
jgi:hypothetical protein